MEGKITVTAYQMAKSLKEMRNMDRLKEVITKYNLNSDKI
jgi:hypothetical protein